MFRTIVYSAFGLGVLINFVYLIGKGFSTDYTDYNIASVTASYAMLLVMGWHMKIAESDWNGLWLDGMSLESKRWVRTGMWTIIALCLVGIILFGLLGLQDHRFLSQTRNWMSHFLFIFYLLVNVHFILLCLFGDRILFTRSAKIKVMRPSGANLTLPDEERRSVDENAKHPGVRTPMPKTTLRI